MDTPTKSVAPKGKESPDVVSAPFSASSAYSYLALAAKRARDAREQANAAAPDKA